MGTIRRRVTAASILAVTLLQILFVTNVTAPIGQAAIATDADIGISSLATLGGQKLIEDSFGKTIVVYVDQAGRLALTYTNSNPQVTGLWVQPVKASPPKTPYLRPAAILATPTLLKIIVEGGTGNGMINDVNVTIHRDPSNNIVGIGFGRPVTLDGSGLAKYPAAILALNGDVLAAWNWVNTTDSSRVKSLRWNSSSRTWTRFNGTGIVADDAIVDTSNKQAIIPTLIQRRDNNNVYLFGNRAQNSSAMTMVFARAVFTNPNWNWGAQNLTYETQVARGVSDAPSAAWDSGNNLVVVTHAVASVNVYSVFTLNATDFKTHIDTPSTATTNNEWGSLEVNATSGAYFIFFVDTTNTTTLHGRLGYVTRVGTTWNTTFNVIDSGTNNEGVSVRASGDACCIDLLYAKGTSPPATIYFVRISATIPLSTSVTLNVSPSQLSVGQKQFFSGTLTSAMNGTAVRGRTVIIQQSLDSVFWSTIGSVVTMNDGSYNTSITTSSAQTFRERALFQGDDQFNTSFSTIVTVTVALDFANPYALIGGSNGTLYAFNGTILNKISVQTKADLLNVAWRPDGAYALISGSGGTLLKFAPSGKNFSITNIPTGLSPGILLHTIAWKPNSTLAYVGGTSGTLITYNGQSVTPVATGLTNAIFSMAWNSTGRLALLAGPNGMIATYNGTIFTQIHPAASYTLNTVAWTPFGSAYIGGTLGALFKYNGTLSRVANSTLFGDSVESIVFNPSVGNGLITGTSGMAITYTQGVLKRLTNYTDLNGHSQLLRGIGNLYSTVYPAGSSTGYTVGSNGTVARIVGTSVALLSQHLTNQPFLSISWRPFFTVDFTSNPPEGMAQQPVTFTALIVGGSPPYNVSWTFGDGANAKGNVVTHVYSIRGLYNVTLAVTDFNGTRIQASHTIMVRFPGDVNIDCVVDIVDMSLVGAAFGSTGGPTPSRNWNPLADVNGDGLVDITDLVVVASHFGKTCVSP